MKATKYVLPVVAGAMVAMMLIVLGERYISGEYPLLAFGNVLEKISRGKAIAAMPVNAFVLLLLIYSIAAFIAGVVAAIVAKGGTIAPAIVIGIVLTLLVFVQNLSIPYPAWFVGVRMFVFVPFAYLGCMVMKRRRRD